MGEAFKPLVAPERAVLLRGNLSVARGLSNQDPSPASLFFSLDICLITFIASPLKGPSAVLEAGHFRRGPAYLSEGQRRGGGWHRGQRMNTMAP